MGCHFLPQGIFLTQGLNQGLLHGWQILYCLSHQGRSHILLTVGTCVICAVSRASLHHSNLLTHQTLTNDCLYCSVAKLCLTLSPPQTTARQASLSFTICQSFLKLMSIELLTPSNHLSHPLPAPSPPALNLSQHQCLFRWVGSSHQVAKVLELQRQSSHECSRLISFRKWLPLKRHKFLGISRLSCGWAGQFPQLRVASVADCVKVLGEQMYKKKGKRYKVT